MTKKVITGKLERLRSTQSDTRKDVVNIKSIEQETIYPLAKQIAIMSLELWTLERQSGLSLT